jgi:hypothetical protein
MWDLRSIPYAEVEPLLVEVQPGLRPRHNISGDQAALVPAKDRRMIETEGVVFIRMGRIVFKLGFPDEHCRGLACLVVNVY